MNDILRAAIMAVVTSGLSVLVLLHIANLNADQIAGINLFVGNAVILLALAFKKGQGAGPTPSP